MIRLLLAALVAAFFVVPAHADPLDCEADPGRWHDNWRAQVMNANPGLVEKALDADHRAEFVWAFNNSKPVSTAAPAQVYVYGRASSPQMVVAFVDAAGCIEMAAKFPMQAVLSWLQGMTLEGKRRPEA